MNTRRFIVLLVYVVMMTPLGAQEVEKQTWPGKITMYGERPQPVSFSVWAVGGDSGPVIKKITAMDFNERSFEIMDLQIRPETLSFNLDLGWVKRCELRARENGSFAGQCSPTASSSEEDRVTITMRPQRSNE
jgi:hypothetical protein